MDLLAELNLDEKNRSDPMMWLDDSFSVVSGRSSLRSVSSSSDGTQSPPITPWMPNFGGNGKNHHKALNRSQSMPVPHHGKQDLPISSSRYKTEMCHPFEENGTCKYGDKCQFAHGYHELRGLARHPKYKTEPCRTFHAVGLCSYGSRCHFIHGERVLPKPKPAPLYMYPSLTTDLPPRSISAASSLSTVNFPFPMGQQMSPIGTPPLSPTDRLPIFNEISAPSFSAPAFNPNTFSYGLTA